MIVRIDYYRTGFSRYSDYYLESSEKYNWDNNDNLLSIENVGYYGNNEEYSNERKEYVYDSNGKLLEILKKDKNGKLTEHGYANGKDDNYYSRVYYPETKKTKTFTYTWYDNGNPSKCTINYFNEYSEIEEYDKGGNVTKLIYDGKTYKSTTIYKYTYDAFGNWTVCQEYLDDTLIKITRREITYY